MATYGFPWPSMLDCDKFPLDNDMCIASQSERSEGAAGAEGGGGSGRDNGGGDDDTDEGRTTQLTRFAMVARPTRKSHANYKRNCTALLL